MPRGFRGNGGYRDCIPLCWKTLAEIHPEFSKRLQEYFPETEVWQNNEEDVSGFSVTQGGSWEEEDFVTNNGNLWQFYEYDVKGIYDEYIQRVKEMGFFS